MNDLFKTLNEKKITLPDEVYTLLNSCRGFTVYDTTEQLAGFSEWG